MENSIILTILIVENILLLGLLLIWTNRHCQKCQKVKCIERILNKLCSKCQDKPQSAEKKKEYTQL